MNCFFSSQNALDHLPALLELISESTVQGAAFKLNTLYMNYHEIP